MSVLGFWHISALDNIHIVIYKDLAEYVQWKLSIYIMTPEKQDKT